MMTMIQIIKEDTVHETNRSHGNQHGDTGSIDCH